MIRGINSDLKASSSPRIDLFRITTKDASRVTTSARN